MDKNKIKGISLIESLVCLVIVGIGFIGVNQMISFATTSIDRSIDANKINYIDKPYTRFEGTEFEQNTFFIEDPNGNVLELKTFD